MSALRLTGWWEAPGFFFYLVSVTKTFTTKEEEQEEQTLPDHLPENYPVAVGCGDAKIAYSPKLIFDRR